MELSKKEKMRYEKIEKEVNYIKGYRKPLRNWEDENYVEWVRCFNRRYDMYY